MAREEIDFKHAAIIINPVSGQGDPHKRKKVITALAMSHGWKGVVAETTKKRGAGTIASELIKKGHLRFIVCGGDGTIMQVLEMAAKTDSIIGVIPLGTGNLFAQNLGIPISSEEAMNIIFTGKTKQIDVGHANSIFFSIMAGIGLDADIVREADRELKNKIGWLAYLLSALKQFTNKSGYYSLQVDTSPAKTFRAKSILIANLGKITGGINAVPYADPQSGNLQIGIIQASSWYSWLDLLFNALKGRIHDSPHYTLMSGKKILIESRDKPMSFQCDGNDFPPVAILSVQIYPLAVSVRVPN